MIKLKKKIEWLKKYWVEHFPYLCNLILYSIKKRGLYICLLFKLDPDYSNYFISIKFHLILPNRASIEWSIFFFIATELVKERGISILDNDTWETDNATY